MFVRALPEGTQSNLATIARTPLATRFYLAGGTAVGLHLGHRLSYDLGFFSLQPFPPDLPRRALAPLGELSVSSRAWSTLRTPRVTSHRRCWKPAIGPQSRASSRMKCGG